jgi:hypothetical protein
MQNMLCALLQKKMSIYIGYNDIYDEKRGLVIFVRTFTVLKEIKKEDIQYI